jgi:hypothetical protein
MSVPFLLDERAHRLGFTRWLKIDYSVSHHVLWSGRTGSGKTVAAKLLLARSILLAPPELQPVEVTVIDPKEDVDFDYLDGLPRFYRGDEAPHGFSMFFSQYIERKKKRDTTRNLKILFVDEFASLVDLIDDKKEREATQKKMKLLVALTRSKRFSVHMATQQPSANIFNSSGGGSGVRSQFGACCLLGDAGGDTETLQMMFSGESREHIKSFGSIGGRAVGWLALNGGIAQPVRVPHIEDMGKLNAVIQNNLAQKAQKEVEYE